MDEETLTVFARLIRDEKMKAYPVPDALGGPATPLLALPSTDFNRLLKVIMELPEDG